MKTTLEDMEKLRETIAKIKRTYAELISLEKYLNAAQSGEKKIISSQIILVKQALKKTNDELPAVLDKINLLMPLTVASGEQKDVNAPDIRKIIDTQTGGDSPGKRAMVEFDTNSEPPSKPYTLKELRPTRLEKLTLNRMKEKDMKIEVQAERKPSDYIKFANNIFAKTAEKMIGDQTFKELEKDLIQANLLFTPRSYVSTIFLTTCIAFFVGIFIAMFFFFFKVTATLPILSLATSPIGTRLLTSLGIILFVPIITFLIMYSYPGLEKSSTGNRIDDELPFATIHMSAISGSMIDPSKIFNIIISTHEYPYLEKEFKKLINKINLYGYDLVTALRSSSYNSPSRKLSELFNGLATTINSGGYLPEFFDKRSQTLLFDNRLEQEKKTKAAETFMDIYISLVVAAPMILMILLMMMKISGLGVAMSTQMITIVMVTAVTMINIVFLTFLQLKR